MKRDAGGLRKALESVGDHLRAQRTDLLALETQIDDRVWPIRKIDHRPRQGLIERCIAAAKSQQGRSRAKGLCKRGAQR